MTLNSLIAAVAALQRLDGVAGVMLFKGRNTVHRQMPFSEGRALDLTDTLGQMLDGYRQVRRKIRQIYLEFDAGVLLVMVLDETVLVFLLTGRADADLAASAATVLLNDHASLLAGLSIEPGASTPRNEDGIEELVVTSPRRLQEMTDKAEVVVNNWGQVRKVIEGILGKVMGRAQVANLIDRTLQDGGIADPYRLNPLQVRKLAVSVIEHIPNVSKRRQLLTELDSHLDDL
ncbi:hypothetical protein SAMN02745166_03849 [Prosthecobacter debontii]|uniref:Uncharacterized protein n=1 Tax=Prosthecobacter debontii TaxID=48467 RepID=A0A1T4YP88_9BACT|nr:hypothetical protein [Prosthecobacter debontii]SKB03582.1 hypothetical protein SAMN02745166_03849 [Prosthecobacter debontii]